MSAELRVLSGARAGTVLPIARDAIAGRRPDCDLRFDPEQDRAVSGRHALIGRRASGRWFVRDMGSTNGTYVNDQRIEEAELQTGDRIMFGWQGPVVEFIVLDADAAGEAVATVAQPALSATGTHRVLAENVRLRAVAGGLIVLLVVVIGVAVWSGARQRAALERERASLQATVDSALAAAGDALRRLAGEREELRLALEQSQSEARQVRDRLQSAVRSPDTSNVPDLRRQLQTVLAALERQQLAASLDFDAIERAARRAVAVIWVENANGQVAVGTAFAIRPDATLLTNRHIVLDAQGRPPRRVGIQFADSDQVWPARILRVADAVDLAIVKVDNIRGQVPTVRAINQRTDTLAAGVPVAWMGFPLGGETWPQDARTGRIARPLGAVGVITATGSAGYEIQGYGAAGLSGSPVLDANGEVIAILYGGSRGATGQVLHAIPASEAIRLIGGSDES